MQLRSRLGPAVIRCPQWRRIRRCYSRRTQRYGGVRAATCPHVSRSSVGGSQPRVVSQFGPQHAFAHELLSLGLASLSTALSLNSGHSLATLRDAAGISRRGKRSNGVIGTVPVAPVPSVVDDAPIWSGVDATTPAKPTPATGGGAKNRAAPSSVVSAPPSALREGLSLGLGLVDAGSSRRDGRQRGGSDPYAFNGSAAAPPIWAGDGTASDGLRGVYPRFSLQRGTSARRWAHSASVTHAPALQSDRFGTARTGAWCASRAWLPHDNDHWVRDIVSRPTGKSTARGMTPSSRSRRCTRAGGGNDLVRSCRRRQVAQRRPATTP